MCAAAAGASPIVITDLAQERLDFAKKLCPEVHTFKIDLSLTSEESARQIVKLFTAATHGVGGETMPSKVLECTGVESSIAVASYACKPSGLVFVLGVGKSHLTIPFMHLSTNEIDLKFLFRYVSSSHPHGGQSRSQNAADSSCLHPPFTARHLAKGNSPGRLGQDPLAEADCDPHFPSGKGKGGRRTLCRPKRLFRKDADCRRGGLELPHGYPLP